MRPLPAPPLLSPALLCLALICLAFFAAGPLQAIGDRERLSDPALEAKARAIFKEVRCVVCQNQSIDDSEAQIAKDLRIIIREQLVDGRNEEQILGFLTARYGDYVLLEPPFELDTLLLWLTPPIVLAAGGLLVWGSLRGRARSAEAAPLSADEQARLDKLLGSDRS